MTFLWGKINHGDLHVVLNQPLYQLWLFACNLTAVNSIMYLCKIQLSSVHSHPTFREAWCSITLNRHGSETVSADKILTKPRAHFNEKWQKTKMKNYVTLNILQTWHSLLLLRLTLEQMARNVDTTKSATKAIFILKFQTTYCSAKHSRSVTEEKNSDHDYLFISKWCHLNHVYNRKKKNWTVSF